MRNKIQWFAFTSALLCALIVIAPAAAQVCTPIADAGSVGVSLITQPFAYSALRPALTAPQIQALGALPNAGDEIVHRENAYISTALASALGIAPHAPAGTLTVNPNWRGANPQIRVWIEQPATFSNWQKRVGSTDTYRNRSSSAVFTVVGVVDGAQNRIWVYRKRTSTDRDSGEYKLFAADTVDGTGKRVYAAQSFPDANADGILDGVTARAFRTPTSSRAITRNGVTTPETSYCEPDANGSLQESGVNVGDNRVAAFAPHGGVTESGTSEQLAPFQQALAAAPFSVPVNSWDVQGTWGDDQTPKRWHATATNISEQSSPALQAVLDQPWFDPAGQWAFRFAVAFHGFSASSSTALEVSVGGQTAQNTKCLVVVRTADELAAAGLSRKEMAFIIHDSAGIIDVADKNSKNVSRRDLAGTADTNFINRLAADGGLQLEQSKAVRDDATLRTAVARGAARALGEVINGTAPANACSSL